MFEGCVSLRVDQEGVAVKVLFVGCLASGNSSLGCCQQLMCVSCFCLCRGDARPLALSSCNQTKRWCSQAQADVDGQRHAL